MQGKKRYLALVLFLLLGLVVFSFASPEEQLEPVENSGVKKVSESNTKTEKENTKPKTKYEEAKELVEVVEQNPTNENIEEAMEVIQQVTPVTEQEDLINRVNIPEPTINAAELITQVEKMIAEATSKDNIKTAEEYFDNNNVATITDTVEDETVKENLDKRVAYLVKVFEDNTEPVITGINNNQVTKDAVELTIEEDLEYKTTVTLNGETVDFEETFEKEGLYVVTVTDDAQNTKSITFTIDKTKPVFEGLPSREAHVDGYTVSVTDATNVVITLQTNHGEFVEIADGTVLSDEATYQLVAVDEAGNKFTTWVIVDRTKPTISGVTNGSIVNKCERIYVADRYLDKVVINGVTYIRKDFTSNTKNEDFKFETRVCSEGIYTITATDKKGQSYTETFEIDKSAPTYKFYKEGSSLEKDELEPVEKDGRFYFTENVRVVFKDNKYFTQYVHNDFVNNEDKKTITSWTREAKVDGIHTMKVTDAAGNVTEITLVVDTTAPTYKFYKEGSSLPQDEIQPIVKDGKLYFNQNVRVVFDENIHFTQYVHNDFVNNEDKITIQSWTREAKTEGAHTMKVTDAVGHTTEISFIIDKTAPKVAVKDSSVGKDGVYSKLDLKLSDNNKIDKFTVNGVEFDRTDAKYSDANFANIKSALKEGINTIVLYDIAGNSTTYEVTMDYTSPVANYTAVIAMPMAETYDVFVKNGETIRFLVQFNEEIVIPEAKENKTFELLINNKVVKFQRSQGAGYEYIAQYKIAEDEAELLEGEITFEIKGAKDKAGNEIAPITSAKHHKYNKVIYDRTAPAISAAVREDLADKRTDVVASDANGLTLYAYKDGVLKKTHKASTSIRTSFNHLGYGSYRVVAIDRAGNESEVTYSIKNPDITNESTLKDAFATGGTYKVLEDIVIDEAIELPENKEIVLDLNDKTITMVNPENEDGRLIQSNGKLTIKNGKLSNTGKSQKGLIDSTGELVLEDLDIEDNGSYTGSTIVNDGGKLSLNNVTIKIDSDKTGCQKGAEACGNTGIYNTGDLTVKNSSITSNSGSRYGITTNAGNVLIENVTLNINRRGGMAITGGNVTVNNVTTNAYWYAFYVTNESGDTDVTINSGTYTSSSYSAIYNGNAVATNKGLVTVNGGDFKSTTGKTSRTIVLVDGSAAEGQKFGVEIKGGTWTSAKANNAKDFVADGYQYNNGVVTPIAE